jgi:hypothetical protein
MGNHIPSIFLRVIYYVVLNLLIYNKTLLLKKNFIVARWSGRKH